MLTIKSRCKMSNFENLKVWHRAVELAVSIYNVTEDNKSLKKDSGLKDHIRRAAVSISGNCNLSEGDELGTDKQAVKHFFIAEGSTAAHRVPKSTSSRTLTCYQSF